MPIINAPAAHHQHITPVSQKTLDLHLKRIALEFLCPRSYGSHISIFEPTWSICSEGKNRVLTASMLFARGKMALLLHTLEAIAHPDGTIIVTKQIANGPKTQYTATVFSSENNPIPHKNESNF